MGTPSPATAAPAPHRVAIVGGGFAGLHAAKRLGKYGFAVTLLDKRNFQLFQPLLYQVATGQLAPGDIAIPQRVVLRKFPNVRVIQATAYDIDPDRRIVFHEYGEEAYDSLVVATGVKHHYFGHDDWRPFAPGMKTVEHALEIRRKLFDACERAEVESDPVRQAELLTFVVVGGGPTGVELAGAVGELCHHTMPQDFRRIDTRKAKILLVEGAPDVLQTFDPKLRAAARRSLENLGVTVITETFVDNVADGVVHTRSKAGVQQVIRCGNIMWAAGVSASRFGEILAQRTAAVLDTGPGGGGRVKVAPDCSLPGRPEIFVVGDLARLKDAKGVDVPGLAQGAIQEGRYVAEVLRRRIAGRSPPPPFRYSDLGVMAVIGMNHAVGEIKGFKVRRWFAWFLWAFVHIMALIDGAQRARVTVLWTWKYFTRKSGDRLITGDPTRTSELREQRLLQTRKAG